MLFNYVIVYYTNNINSNLLTKPLFKTLILNAIIIYIIVGYTMKNYIQNAYTFYRTSFPVFFKNYFLDFIFIQTNVKNTIIFTYNFNSLKFLNFFLNFYDTIFSFYNLFII